MNTKLEKLWNNVIESPNKEVEFENVEKLSRYISRKVLYFNIIVTDDKGNKYKLPNDFPIINDIFGNDDIFIKKVYLVIYDGDEKVFESDKWEPKSEKNVYMFYNE